MPARTHRITCFACLLMTFSMALFGAAPVTGPTKPTPLILDMVHNNPGEKPFDTRYNDPAVLKAMGYTGKVFFLFESAQLAVNWDSVDRDLLPADSPDRKWVDVKAAELTKKYDAAKSAGLSVYCESDLIIFPKKLVEKEGMQETFGDPSNPQTQKYLNLLLDQMFDQFPQLDGLVVRVGETYLQDAPFHVGKVGVAKNDKSNVEKTIIPLLQLLRENVCVKHHKNLVFRTWLSFDTSVEKYMAVSNAVEPHPNLYFAIKHCEGDFNRGNPFSRTLGLGRHRFIVEVECAREYEGKGAYPNYIDQGLIDGFEEHRNVAGMHSFAEVQKSPLFAGLWTWTRGGGWEGPYITNELWCDLNASIIVDHVRHPEQSEEQLFDAYCETKLHLDAPSTAKFRQLCLLSAEAIIRGKRTTATAKDDTISPFWTRDDKIGAPPLPKNVATWPMFLKEKDTAVADWEKIVALAESISFPDRATGDYVVTSSRYGLYLYRIYRAAFQLAVEHAQGQSPSEGFLAEYDSAWDALKKLKAEHPECATVYKDVGYQDKPGAGAYVESLRPKSTP